MATAEPQTGARLLIHTNYGDLEVELWAKECPQTSKRFLSLCLFGAYDGTLFHRLVQGFCIQGGEPSSKFLSDEPFPLGELPKEYHSRLHFNRMGLLGMVSLDTRHSHPTQFFFTLAATPELDRESTCFGRVIGDSIFNLRRMEEVPVREEDESPVWEIRIRDVEVLENPFEDIEVFRKRVEQAEEAPKIVIKPIKESRLMSFEVEKTRAKQKPDVDIVTAEREEKIRALRERISKLKGEIKPEVQEKVVEPIAPEPFKQETALEKLRKRYIGKRERDQEDTLIKLTSFRQRLKEQQKGITTEKPQAKRTHLLLCKLHGLAGCESCKIAFGIKDLDLNEEDSANWMLHRLVFDRADIEPADFDHNLVVIDPKAEMARYRNQAKQT